MHHRLDAVRQQDVVQVVHVPQVADHQRVGRHGRPVAHAQVVEHRHGVPAGQQPPHRVAADVPGPARHQ